jgi:hypothetical protein
LGGETPFKWPEVGKNGKWKKLHNDYPHIRVLAGFVSFDGVKYGAENSPI